MIKDLGCYILDDEESAIKSIKRHVEATPGLSLKGYTTSPATAMEELAGTDYLLFLDISLAGVSGLNLAKNLSNKIVFTTAHDEYALDSFDNPNTIDYIVKPIMYDRFLQAVRKASGYIPIALDSSINSDILHLKTDGRVVKIDVDAIEYVEAAGNYSRIICEDEKILAPMNLGQLAPLLPGERFVRVHKSYIVNKAKIKSVSGDILMLRSEAKIKVGRTYKQNIQNS